MDVDELAAAIAERLHTPQPQPRLLTVKAAAIVLNRSTQGVYRLINAGLPVVRMDRRIFIDRHDIEQWITRHKH